jgi:aldose 1-epimerase
MKKMTHGLILCGAAACLAVLAGCSQEGASTITQAPYGTTPDGKAVDIYTLRNSKGAEARIITYGGIVVSLKMPDKHGDLGDVVLGCNSLEDYEKATTYFGALIGRYGNRIGKAQFTLAGKTYHLATNNNGNTLHGGNKGFDKVVWTAIPHESMSGFPATLELQYTSKDGEEGFPGTLKVGATYSLTDSNELRIDFTATTDKNTVVNLTHHSYFNLAGKGDILGHIVTIPAAKITPVDAGLIPTGEITSVEGTPFDFRKPTAIGLRLDQTNTSEQLKFGPGYDHNWVFDKKVGDLTLMARVSEPTSGRVMEVWSTEPALQFYSGNFLDGTIKGKDGWVYQKHAAFCMEPQHYPDSPNKPQFPTTELRPGQHFHNAIIYRFSVAK